MIAADRVAAVLLAAGRSTRFGEADKLTAMIGGRPLATHAAAMLAGMGFGRLIAVCAEGAAAPAADLAAIGFTIVRAPAGSDQSASLAAGIAAAGDAEAALICLADMPFVPAAHITALLAAAGDGTIVATGGDGRPMAPALFGRRHFDALGALSGDRGARDMLAQARLAPLSPHFLRDIDRAADIEGA